MRQWSCSFTKEAQEDIDRLDKKVRNRVLDKIKWLLINFEMINHLPLGYGGKDFLN